MLILIAIATFVATLIGGLFAMRFKDKLHLILGFSAGAVIAVAFFDLLPEALDLGSGFYSTGTITSVVALGFVAYLILDRLIFLHGHSHEEGGAASSEVEGTNEAHETSHPETSRGILGASSLSLHSFLDGVAIGLAFQVSTAVGTIVTIAVLTHDFSDGINTVSVILKNKGERSRAMKWLLIDATAPVLGVASTMLFSVPAQGLSLILAVFTGFFLYIGATDLIPESHHAHPKFLTTFMTIVGAGVLYAAIHFAGV